jgi:hypothetical protein
MPIIPAPEHQVLSLKGNGKEKKAKRENTKTFKTKKSIGDNLRDPRSSRGRRLRIHVFGCGFAAVCHLRKVSA